MSFLVKYQLSDPAIIRSLELIAQINGNLQVLRMNQDWASLLERQAGLKEAIGSIGIEGTVISLDQAKAITIGDDLIDVGEKEKREFLGYQESLLYIKSKLDRELTLSSLLSIHESITIGDRKAEPGKIRNRQNRIESRGKTIYTPPPSDQLGFLLKEFLSWFNKTANDKDFSPIIAAGICHFWFVWIHPFMDGNGRVARVLTTYLLLKKKSEGIRYFSISDYYNTNKDKYYDALEKSNICDPRSPAMNYTGNLSTWLKFFIESFYAQSKMIREVTNRILQLNIRINHLRSQKLITEAQDRLLEFLFSREKASYPELIDHLGISGARVNQILKPLREAEILVEERIGKLKWFKLGAPEGEPNEQIFKRKLKTKSVDKNMPSAAKQGVLPIFGSDFKS